MQTKKSYFNLAKLLLLIFSSSMVFLSCVTSQQDVMSDINQIKLDMQKVRKNQEKNLMLLETEQQRKDQTNSAQIETMQNTLISIKDKLDRTESEVKILTGKIEELQYNLAQKEITSSSSPSFTGRIKAKQPADTTIRTPLAENKPTSGTAAAASVQPPAGAPVQTPAQPPAAAPVQTPMPASSTQTSFPRADEIEFAYGNARTAFSTGKYDKAISVLKDFLAKYPDYTDRAESVFLLAESYYYSNDIQNAKVSFQKTYDSYKISPKAPDSLAFLGQIAKQEGKKDEAVKFFEKILSEYPSYAEIERIKEEIKAIKQE